MNWKDWLARRLIAGRVGWKVWVRSWGEVWEMGRLMLQNPFGYLFYNQWISERNVPNDDDGDDVIKNTEHLLLNPYKFQEVC